MSQPDIFCTVESVWVPKYVEPNFFKAKFAKGPYTWEGSEF